MSGARGDGWVERAAGIWTRGQPGARGSKTVIRIGQDYVAITNRPPRAAVAIYSSLETALAAESETRGEADRP
jgi:hypothetical protein